jgi:hypothetical protein
MVLENGFYGGYPATKVLMTWFRRTKLMVLEKGLYGGYPATKILMTNVLPGLAGLN